MKSNLNLTSRGWDKLSTYCHICLLNYRTKTLAMQWWKKYDFQYVNCSCETSVVSHKDKYKNKLNQEAVAARGADLLQCARETANKLNGIYIFMTHSIYGRNWNSLFWRPFSSSQSRCFQGDCNLQFRKFSSLYCWLRHSLSLVVNIKCRFR